MSWSGRSRVMTIILSAVLLLAPVSVGAQTTATAPAPKRVAEIAVAGPVGERPPVFDFLAGGEVLWRLVARMDKARVDGSVRAVSLVFKYPAISFASALELEAAVKRLRKAGKKVHVYSEFFSLPTYIVASAADEVVAPPSGMLIINGLRGEVLMWKGLFDLIGLQAEFVKVGEYKSASEPFTLEKLSPATRAMYDRLMDDLFDEILARIAANRGLSREAVKKLIDVGIFDGAGALGVGLVDRLAFVDGFHNSVIKKTGKGAVIVADYAKKKPAFSMSGNPFTMLANLFAPQRRRRGTKPTIALIVASGVIVPGEGNQSILLPVNVIAASTFLSVLKEIRSRDDIKAIVVRVDSPGGSAVASDIIWSALRDARRRLPVVVSMSDVAASGGYYIACAGHHVVAEPCTVTGSIGVIGGKLNLKGLYGKIGLQKEIFSRGANAGLFSDYGPLGESERGALQGLLEATYKRFLDRVRSGRKIGAEKLAAAAGGRVWSGRRALEMGLVDELGTLELAVRRAAERANLKPGRYEIELFPKSKTIADVLAKGFKVEMGAIIRQHVLKELGWLGMLLEKEPVLALPDFWFELK